MRGNWFAVSRSIVENELFTKKPLWGWAWVNILSSTKYKTGEVCLTEVYRDFSGHFTYSQWRHMVSVFVKEEMLELSEAVNLGDRAGHRQNACVLNWSKYQKIAQSERRAGAERTAVSYNNSEQVKQESSSVAYEPPTQGDYIAVVRAVGHPVAEWLRDKRDFDFARAVSLWGEHLETLWKAAVHAESRKHGDKAMFRFQDACEGSLDLSVKPPWQALPVSPRRAAALVPGDHARTPDGHTHTILDVCANGMVVFEDDSPPVHLRSLEPVLAAVA